MLVYTHKNINSAVSHQDRKDIERVLAYGYFVRLMQNNQLSTLQAINHLMADNLCTGFLLFLLHCYGTMAPILRNIQCHC